MEGSSAAAEDGRFDMMLLVYNFMNHEKGDRVLAGDPTTRELLNADNIPTLYKIVPNDGTDVEFLRGLKERYLTLPSVTTGTLAEEQLDLISKLQSFVSIYTTGLWIALMFASGLLIWNTIRTAMFARRREIEVMKLVGATDWFIRIPFMLEGLLHGIVGAGLASAGLWLWNGLGPSFGLGPAGGKVDRRATIVAVASVAFLVAGHPARRAWADDDALWMRAVRVEPRAALHHHNVSNTYFRSDEINQDEFRLYEQVYEQVAVDAPVPARSGGSCRSRDRAIGSASATIRSATCPRPRGSTTRCAGSPSSRIGLWVEQKVHRNFRWAFFYFSCLERSTSRRSARSGRSRAATSKSRQNLSESFRRRMLPRQNLSESFCRII